MTHIIEKDILTVPHGIIVHQVNMAGVMGAGLARRIADRWPLVKYMYKNAVTGKMYQLGDIQKIEVEPGLLYIVNLFGQRKYGRETGVVYTNYDAVARGLSATWKFSLELAAPYRPQIYIPFGMGCGLGGGNWDVIYELIKQCTPTAVICKLVD